MTVERAVWRWKTAGGALLLVGTGLLTRVACAPPPVARAPSAPEVEAGPARAVGAAAGGPAMPAAAAPTPDARGRAGQAAAAGGSGDTPFAGIPSAAPAAADDDAPVDAPAGAAPASSVPPMQRQELALLASIERELEREPPPEVHALLGDYRRGADRSTLVARVQRDFPDDLRLRVTVLRWIDQVRPDPKRPSAAPPVPGQGSGTPWVRPLERR